MSLHWARAKTILSYPQRGSKQLAVSSLLAVKKKIDYHENGWLIFPLRSFPPQTQPWLLLSVTSIITRIKLEISGSSVKSLFGLYYTDIVKTSRVSVKTFCIFWQKRAPICLSCLCLLFDWFFSSGLLSFNEDACGPLLHIWAKAISVTSPAWC